MQQSHARRWLQRGLILAVVVGIGFAIFDYCWNAKRRAVLAAMAQECHPIWHDLETGRVREGDDVEQVILRMRPHAVERDGKVVGLRYHPPGSYTGIKLIARDGKLVSAIAWSCT